jgi:hypothetical protein
VVFPDAAIAHLGNSKNMLQNAERMLHPLTCISHRRLVDLGESGRRKIAGKAVFSVA